MASKQLTIGECLPDLGQQCIFYKKKLAEFHAVHNLSHSPKGLFDIHEDSFTQHMDVSTTVLCAIQSVSGEWVTDGAQTNFHRKTL